MKIDRISFLSPFGYLKYKQEVEKNKKKFYNRVEIDKTILPDGCGTKINVTV
jgi:hypothetical protein